MMDRRRSLLEGGKKRLLPDEYQQVEWVENTGVRYITAGTIQKTFPLTMKIGFYRTASAQYQSIVCGVGYAHQGSYNLGIMTNGGVGAFVKGQGYWINGAPTNLNTCVDAEFTLENSTKSTVTARYPDGVSYSRTLDVDVTISDTNFVLWQSQNNVKMTGRIYYCEVWQNRRKLMHLIPCYRKSDNEIGMYDVVRKEFRTGAGTGSFTVGPPVT